MNRTSQTAAQARHPWSRLLLVALTALLCLGAAFQARAQAGAQAGGDVDPPDRVARLSDVSGQVWLFSPDSNEWLAVERNRPLTTGDRIATDNGAHAEITLGSTTLRLDSATELEIVLLDDTRYNLHLHSGSVAARLRNAQSVAEFALETDEGRFRVQTVGRYRFDRFEQASDLTVDAGQAVFEGRNSALPLTAGQHAQFWLDASGAPQYNMVEPARDSFAAWNAERDRAEVRPTAAVRYVSPEMTGAEDLDRYGQWEQSPEYGPIWTPRAVAVDWAPYSTGRWTYVRPWGWTWVDDAPWGFAPFHYGRWVHHRNRWCWAPGTYVARPVYAPALVAWVGGGRTSVSISLGGGRGGPPVGWFPLAPREVYVPSYRYSPRYVRNINITHVTNVTQITTIVNNTNGAADRRDFANRKFPHAVTVVPASVLTGRQSVAAEAARYRGDPQVRALVADARPAATTIVAPVAAPARPPSGKVVVTRPPFEGRAPGGLTGRPGPDRGQGTAAPAPGVAPQAGASPQGGQPPAPGAAPTRPNSRVQVTPPDGQRPDAGRPGAVAVPDAAAVERPTGRGGDRSFGGRPPPPNVAPVPNAAPAPNVQVTPAAPARTPNVQVTPVAPPSADGRRGAPEESRGTGRPGAVPAPPSGRSVEPRAVDAPRPPPTSRAPEPRPSEAPRVQVRPVEPRVQEAPRAVAPRAVEPPRAVAPAAAPPPAPRAVEVKPQKVQVEPVRPAEPRSRPEASNRDAKNERGDKGERGERQR